MIQISNKKKLYCFWTGILIIIISIISIMSVFKSNSIFQEISNPEMLYTYSDTVVYFGRDDCPACKSAMNILQPVFEEENIKILYFNTNSWREHELFQKILSDFQIDEIPAIVKIKNGKSVGSFPLFDDLGRMDLERIKRICSSYQ